MIVLGLVIVAVGFFLGLIDRTRPTLLPIIIQGIGWGLILYFGVALLLSGHGVVLPQ